MVLLGLDVIMPLMTPQLFKFPKLCRLYFSLLSYVLEVYPEQVGGLNQWLALKWKGQGSEALNRWPVCCVCVGGCWMYPERVAW